MVCMGAGVHYKCNRVRQGIFVVGRRLIRTVWLSGKPFLLQSKQCGTEQSSNQSRVETSIRVGPRGSNQALESTLISLQSSFSSLLWSIKLNSLTYNWNFSFWCHRIKMVIMTTGIHSNHIFTQELLSDAITSHHLEWVGKHWTM